MLLESRGMSVTAERVAVVTGASSGIGKEAAKAIARQGWRVIALGRDAQRSAAAAQELRAAGNVEMIVADLALMAEAARAAREIAARTDRIDVLINNAGGMCKAMVITPEGLEENFAGNHLGPFLLTTKLLPLLRRAAADAPKGGVRIINTSSDASEMIPSMDLADMQAIDIWSSGGAYCRAKLANVLFARALAQRLAGEGIVAHALHPGTIDSNFIAHAEPFIQEHIKTLKAMSSEEGADALIWLATADEPGRSSGGYYHQRTPKPPNPLAEDDAYVARFWDESEKLIARVPV
jgi:NAD(P)-dependent dehydrogenase (short-subunit alcohol dehydrogenase family)